MRSDVLVSAVLAGVEETVKEAKQKFYDWMNKGTRIPPNLREAIYSAGIKYGGVKEWQFCWNKYNTTRVPSERKLLLRVLGVASDPWILQRYDEISEVFQITVAADFVIEIFNQFGSLSI